jgi:hypothetical protein
MQGNGLAGEDGSPANLTPEDAMNRRLGALIRKAVAMFETGRTVTPEMVIDAASAPDHPLHGWLEWNNAIAAQTYRLAIVRRWLRGLS